MYLILILIFYIQIKYKKVTLWLDPFWIIIKQLITNLTRLFSECYGTPISCGCLACACYEIWCWRPVELNVRFCQQPYTRDKCLHGIQWTLESVGLWLGLGFFFYSGRNASFYMKKLLFFELNSSEENLVFIVNRHNSLSNFVGKNIHKLNLSRFK